MLNMCRSSSGVDEIEYFRLDGTRGGRRAEDAEMVPENACQGPRSAAVFHDLHDSTSDGQLAEMGALQRCLMLPSCRSLAEWSFGTWPTAAPSRLKHDEAWQVALHAVPCLIFMATPVNGPQCSC